MSMHPQPYYAPQMPQYYGAPVDVLRPARRASLLMFIIGPIMLLLATCAFSMPTIIKAMPGQQADQMRAKIAASTSTSLEAACYINGFALAIPGLAITILAVFVRRGGKVATILGCVLIGLVGLVLALSTLANLAMASDPDHAMGACVGLVGTAFMVLQFVWLIQAAIASGKVGLAQQQYAAQYWQYQQTMQAYANAGYGYQTPAQPPTPPAQPPTPSSQPPTPTAPPQLPEVPLPPADQPPM